MGRVLVDGNLLLDIFTEDGVVQLVGGEGNDASHP